MTNPAGETQDGILRPDFDRRVMLQFRGSVVTSNAGLLAYRELDDSLGLTPAAGDLLADARTGKNGRHALVGMLRQSVFGRLAGYEDLAAIDRLARIKVPTYSIGVWSTLDLHLNGNVMGYQGAAGPKKLLILSDANEYAAVADYSSIAFHQTYLLEETPVHRTTDRR